MKGKERILVIVLALLIAACAHSPSARPDPPAEIVVSKMEIMKTAVEVGRSMNFPEITRFDEEKGIVEFGAFGKPVVGLTAQVKISPDNTNVGIIVKRGALYVPASAEATGREFMRKFEEKLREKHSI